MSIMHEMNRFMITTRVKKIEFSLIDVTFRRRIYTVIKNYEVLNRIFFILFITFLNMEDIFSGYSIDNFKSSRCTTEINYKL